MVTVTSGWAVVINEREQRVTIYLVLIRLGELRKIIREYISDKINVDALLNVATEHDREYINSYGPLAGPGNDQTNDTRCLRHLGDSLDDEDDEEDDFGPVPPTSQRNLYADVDPYSRDW